MKKTFVVLALLGALLPISCKTVEREATHTNNSQIELSEAKREKSEKWTVWLADGKNDMTQVDPIPAKTPLDHYRENMALIHPWDFDKEHDENDPTRTKLGSPEITRIGEWNEYIARDLRNADIQLHYLQV